MKSKGLEMLARQIGQEIEEKNAALLARDIEVPKEYHESMLAFIRKLDQETKRKEKKEARQRWLRTTAMFVVCFVSLNAAALGVSEAYREKVFSLFYDEEQGGVTLSFDPGRELMEEWEDYWYPAWLPEGYQLYAAERTEDTDFLMFMSEDTKQELRITTCPADAEYSFDTEWMSREDMDIGMHDGYYFFNEEQEFYIVVFGTGEKILIAEHTGKIEKETMQKIAENMQYIK